MVVPAQTNGVAGLALTLAIVLSGCSGGGGGGGGGIITPPVNPIHTEFSVTPAIIYDVGVPYTCSVTVWETRGDPIDLHMMRTWRTWADSSNSGRTEDFYVGAAGYVYGWMFDRATAVPSSDGYDFRNAVITDTSSAPDRSPNRLQGYERRTLSTSVMVGRPYQSKPAGFNGIWITNSKYRSWLAANHPGIKLWVKLEGYDYRLVDNYNIYLPLEIRFQYNPTDPYSYAPQEPGTEETPGTTNPYDTLGSGQ
ncbi:MAG: hypothetical protein OZSIB_1591 [Candidatus Ozemobacter sibiricus]|uniref:Uncharacterized protein n=1 Tax=Candidatus Ozemobacter sibiricus TaxID=2268124 RepID=A0A367ZKQ4_9BACT|nr:MAG: hypothetical protein OZSIB_1591 [Candidatus Ozemobacter sibiricus]